MISKKTVEPMVVIDRKTRALNTKIVERLRDGDGHWVRMENARATDLPLILMCLRRTPPSHVRVVDEGIYAVDLPADVFKVVWMTTEGYWVGTYANSHDRGMDL